jgi:hypothetical protein
MKTTGVLARKNGCFLKLYLCYSWQRMAGKEVTGRLRAVDILQNRLAYAQGPGLNVAL